MLRGHGAAGLACVVAVLGLSACRDREVRPSVGVVVGPVQGLRYQTPTFSGRTDGQGRFSYLPGESVSFSLGGTALGAVPGAPRVTPFDLVGIAPPAGEDETCLALSQTAAASAFGRAVNLALLFMTFDGDADPANGLDLSGADAALTGVTLRPEAPPSVFVRRDVAALGARGRFTFAPTISAAAVWLYDAAGLRVAAHVRTSASYTSPAGAPPAYRAELTFDAQGRVLLERIDTDGDGRVDREAETSWDAAGRQTASVTRTAEAGDGVWTRLSRSTMGYDAAGRVRSVETLEEQPVGTLVSRYLQRYDRGALGPIAALSTEYDGDGAGPQPTSTTRTAYTAGPAGWITALAGEYDRQGDGVADTLLRGTYRYDAAGRDRGYLLEIDDGADGVVDARQELVRTLDGAGNELERVSSDFSDPAGPPSLWQRSARTFDALGNQLTLVEEVDADGDGTAERRAQANWTRDAAGRPLTFSFQPFGPTSGPPSRSWGTTTYDAAGRVRTLATWSDADGDGAFETSTLATTTYDAAGRRVLVELALDLDGDGAVDHRERTTDAYDAEGALVAQAGEADRDGDGVFEITWRYAYGTALREDGLRYLVEHCGTAF